MAAAWRSDSVPPNSSKLSEIPLITEQGGSVLGLVDIFIEQTFSINIIVVCIASILLLCVWLSYFYHVVAYYQKNIVINTYSNFNHSTDTSLTFSFIKHHYSNDT